jgi:hypothetical protein
MHSLPSKCAYPIRGGWCTNTTLALVGSTGQRYCVSKHVGFMYNETKRDAQIKLLRDMKEALILDGRIDGADLIYNPQVPATSAPQQGPMPSAGPVVPLGQPVPAGGARVRPREEDVEVLPPRNIRRTTDNLMNDVALNRAVGSVVNAPQIRRAPVQGTVISFLS